MHLYLYGDSALELLRYLRCAYDERLLDAGSRVRSLTRPAYRMRDLDGLSSETERLLAHATVSERADARKGTDWSSRVIHTLVPDKSQARANGQLRNHLMSFPVPGSAFVRLNKELYLSSPAFIFLQLAHRLDPIELAKLGMELCGTYSYTGANDSYAIGDADSASDAPPISFAGGDAHTDTYTNASGRPPATRSHSVDDLEFNLVPVTTAAKIRAITESAARMPGAQGARMIAARLAGKAASPFETAAYLLMTLPRRLGGYGLPRPELNPEISVRAEQGIVKRRPDLYWRTPSIAVEYNSDYAHSGDWHRYRDAKRQAMLTSSFITVLPLTRDQLMHVDDFHQFVMGLQRLLGLRTRPLDTEWEWKRAQLRRALLLSGRP